MIVDKIRNGVAICGTFPNPEVLEAITWANDGKFLPLVIADPPYGNIVSDYWDNVGDNDEAFCEWMIDWTQKIESLSDHCSALYVWGGIGKPLFRPFYRYLVQVERKTHYRLANHITWAKKRAYGVSHNYLFTREELAYLHLGPEIREPGIFNIPLLDTKRGYAGYNSKYPAKSEYFRRTNVWSDVTEILKGKIHECQKPTRLHEIPIEVHTKVGDWVLDPFAGSGSTALAAINLERRFIVIEADHENYDKMLAHIEGHEVKGV